MKWPRQHLRIAHRDVFREPVPPDGGTSIFETPEALAINESRIRHIESLNLPFRDKSVLDVGSGIGQFARFFIDTGCRLTCMDAREENISELRKRYPQIEAHTVNVETEELDKFGKFDIVFAYGLLYHLEAPVAALRNMGSVCKDLLLLETLVCDHWLPVTMLEDETKAFNQSTTGLGSRPTPSYVVKALSRVGFPFVYAPAKPPDHPDFRFRRRHRLETMRGGHPLRCIFVGSRFKLDNPQLRDVLVHE